MRLRRIPFTAIFWGLVGIAVLAGLVYMEWSRDTVDAVIVSRQERIVPTLTGSSWKRHTEVLARYAVERRVYERWIRVDSQEYDELSRGDTLAVRYVQVNPDWAYAKGQTVFHRVLQDIDLLQVLLVLILLGGVVYLWRLNRRQRLDHWWLRRRSPARRLLLVGVVLLWVQVVVAGYLTPSIPGLGTDDRTVSGEARIRSVVTITQFGGGHRDSRGGLPIGLPQGFHRLELSFIPEGWTLPVIAVDEVDEGTFDHLSGGAVSIRYDPDNPRNALVEGGVRSHQWKNPLITHGVVSLVVVLVLVVPPGVRWFKYGSPVTPGG